RALAKTAPAFGVARTIRCGLRVIGSTHRLAAAGGLVCSRCGTPAAAGYLVGPDPERAPTVPRGSRVPPRERALPFPGARPLVPMDEAPGRSPPADVSSLLHDRRRAHSAGKEQPTVKLIRLMIWTSALVFSSSVFLPSPAGPQPKIPPDLQFPQGKDSPGVV